MNKKGLLSNDFIVQALGLLFSIIIVAIVYSQYIRPAAQDIEITNLLQTTQNPDGSLSANRSVAILLKDYEQQACITLMFWASIIIAHKFIKLNGERSLESHRFLSISKGERIIPDDALAHYKDVQSQVKNSPRMRFKILPDVILAALHRFDSTRSIQDAAHAVKDRAEMAYEQLESDLSLVRYIAWAIPSVGFIGTVRGIGEALAQADQAIRGDISGVTSSLGLAFNSTLIALFLSIVLMFFVHLLQSKQETLLIRIENLVFKRVISLMKTTKRDSNSINFG